MQITAIIEEGAVSAGAEVWLEGEGTTARCRCLREFELRWSSHTRSYGLFLCSHWVA